MKKKSPPRKLSLLEVILEALDDLFGLLFVML